MKWLPIIALCAVCSLLQLHLLMMASPDIHNFLPDWMAHNGWTGYRSRLLGIGLIRLFGGDLRAFYIVTFIGLMAASLLAWRLGENILGLAIFHACFALWANPWFAPWDIFEPAIFICFVLFVVEDRPWYWFVGLFGVAIFNLQSAMFIPLWMVLTLKRNLLIAGLACMAIGTAVMYAFQHSGQPHFGFSVFQCLDRVTTGYSTDYAQLRPIENLHKLYAWDLRVPLGVMLLIGWCCLRVWRRWRALSLMFMALLGATFVFGIVDEMRVWLPFTGLLILAVKS